MAEKRTEYGEVINKKVLGQLHNSPKHNFTVQDVAGGGSGDFDIKGLLERTITEAVVPEDVTSIGDYAFCGCESLTSVELPNVTSIGDYAFGGCSSLTSVVIKNQTPPMMIGNNIFANCHPDLKIYVPASAVDTYKAASDWSDYANKIEAIEE